MTSYEDQHGDFRFFAVSDIGINHRLKNLPNQDSVLFHYSREDFMLAVSDGVGSCVHAALGSEYATEAVKSVFLELLSETLRVEPLEIVNRLIWHWRQMIGDGTPDEFCATLKAAIKINRKLFMISIGDGILAMTSKGMYVISPSEEAYFANQTNCLNGMVTAADFWVKECMLDYNIPFVVFACTDGIANNIQEGREIDLVREIESHSNPQELKTELEMLIVDISEYSSDDRTIGVVRYERENAKPGR
ncbi:MAG: protein phosphatase 2C domain-containing protein [Bacillota bacterium]|jgi:serine/threonine protein phosphatase PrpC